MEIRAYGCSHTAGIEMGDYLIADREDQIKRREGHQHWFQNFRSPFQDHQQVEAREHQLAWPAQAATVLGADAVNRAQGGASLAHSLHRLEQDLPDDHQQRIYVVGVTQPQRILHFRSDHPEPLSGLLANKNLWPGDRWSRHTLLDIYNDAQLLWQHSLLMLRLLQISDQLDGRLWLWAMRDFASEIQQVCKGISRDHRAVFERRLAEIQQHPRANFQRDLFSFAEGLQDFHGLGHARAPVHERFGQWVAATIKGA